MLSRILTANSLLTDNRLIRNSRNLLLRRRPHLPPLRQQHRQQMPGPAAVALPTPVSSALTAAARSLSRNRQRAAGPAAAALPILVSSALTAATRSRKTNRQRMAGPAAAATPATRASSVPNAASPGPKPRLSGCAAAVQRTAANSARSAADPGPPPSAPTAALCPPTQPTRPSSAPNAASLSEPERGTEIWQKTPRITNARPVPARCGSTAPAESSAVITAALPTM